MPKIATNLLPARDRKSFGAAGASSEGERVGNMSYATHVVLRQGFNIAVSRDRGKASVTWLMSAPFKNGLTEQLRAPRRVIRVGRRDQVGRLWRRSLAGPEGVADAGVGVFYISIEISYKRSRINTLINNMLKSRHAHCLNAHQSTACPQAASFKGCPVTVSGQRSRDSQHERRPSGAEIQMKSLKSFLQSVQPRWRLRLLLRLLALPTYSDTFNNVRLPFTFVQTDRRR